MNEVNSIIEYFDYTKIFLSIIAVNQKIGKSLNNRPLWNIINQS